MSTVYKILKRALDIIFAILGLIITLPLILLISLIILVSNGTPVIFLQRRPGLYEKPFTLYKFRTMNNTLDSSDQKNQQDSDRITRLGNFLRSTSLDEMPTLINVLLGHMSFIGPRPLLMKYLERYDSFQKRRHEVRPGITGWAQVNGRNLLSWDEKFKMDIWYIDNQSFMLDLKIFLLTVIKVMKREGISSRNQATGEEFLGNRNNES